MMEDERTPRGGAVAGYLFLAAVATFVAAMLLLAIATSGSGLQTPPLGSGAAAGCSDDAPDARPGADAR